MILNILFKILKAEMILFNKLILFTKLYLIYLIFYSIIVKFCFNLILNLKAYAIFIYKRLTRFTINFLIIFYHFFNIITAYKTFFFYFIIITILPLPIYNIKHNKRHIKHDYQLRHLHLKRQQNHLQCNNDNEICSTNKAQICQNNT